MPILRALAPLALLLLVACGSEKAPPTAKGPQQDPNRPIQFVEGFEAAAARARSPDELILVYVGRHNPT